MITLLQLDYFRKLAAVEHVSKVAKELSISQTALSSMMINLEREVGCQLFDRSKRTIRLNDAGWIYLKYVNDIFTAIENGRLALQDVDAAGAIQESCIHLAMGYSAVWSNLFRDFCNMYPQYTLKQANCTIPQMEKMLVDMTADFVIAGDGDLNIKGAIQTAFKSYDVYLCVSERHPLANRKSVCMEELKNEKFISLNKAAPWSNYCERLFDRAGYIPNVVLECDYTLRASLIESNFGVALTSSAARDVDLLKPNKYIPIRDKYAVREICLYHNPRRYMSAACKNFLDFCVSYYRESVDNLMP